MRADPYSAADATTWNAFVAAGRNGTFLHDRRYMDYHADRFQDCSLLIREGDTLIAVLPANLAGDAAVSHQGLTYGGLVVAPRTTYGEVEQALDAVLDYLRGQGIREFRYKCLPRIYQLLPSDEDAFVLTTRGAILARRDMHSVVALGHRLKPQERRRRGAAKAAKAGIAIEQSHDWAGFWRVLEGTLGDRHGARPVHDLAEIELVAGRFPDNIRLHLARRGAEILGGTVIYATPLVARSQYIAAAPAGLETGALDLLFITLMDQVYAAKSWFDFGASVDAAGVLNRGLLEQKEGFGARAVIQDHYTLAL